jgi:hypothetical protein
MNAQRGQPRGRRCARSMERKAATTSRQPGGDRHTNLPAPARTMGGVLPQARAGALVVVQDRVVDRGDLGREDFKIGRAHCGLSRPTTSLPTLEDCLHLVDPQRPLEEAR